MGCHTWFAKKIERTIDEGRTKWIQNRKKWIIEWQFCIDNPGTPPFEDYSVELMEWQMKVYKRQLRMVEKGLCNCAVMGQQPNDELIIGIGGYRFILGKRLYIDDETTPHDIFRVANYPNNNLFSLEETMEFIRTHDTHTHYTEEERDKKLQEFWNKYPDGYIHFG